MSATSWLVSLSLVLSSLISMLKLLWFFWNPHLTTLHPHLKLLVLCGSINLNSMSSLGLGVPAIRSLLWSPKLVSPRTTTLISLREYNGDHLMTYQCHPVRLNFRGMEVGYSIHTVGSQWICVNKLMNLFSVMWCFLPLVVTPISNWHLKKNSQYWYIF